MKRRKNQLRQPVEALQTPPDTGLTQEQAQLRKDRGWSNGITASAGKTEWNIVAENLFTFFNLVFAVLAAALWLADSSVKHMGFLVVAICNLAIGCFQEIRAKRAVDKLTLVAAQKLRTVRDGEIAILPSDQLVRDDVVEFVVGDQICADGVLLQGTLQVNEALVTGEEDAVTKVPGDKLLSGSFVISGKGRVRLTEVGEDSFASRLAQAAKADPHAAKSEMMRSLDRLIRWVGLVLIPVGLLLFYQEFHRLGNDLTDSTEATVAALVGMIPEGLYLLTSIAMAASALKLTWDKVLVKDLNCIEALARVDVLCVDKTGTITEPGMEVEQVIPLTNRDVAPILTAFYSGMEAENDTAAALIEKFSAQTDWECQKRIPFTSQTKWSAAVFKEQGAFLVGAPEFIMNDAYSPLEAQVRAWLQKGSRVLLLAAYTGEISQTLAPGQLQPLALIILSNRIRAAAPKTFAYFQKQGVAIKVISGDNPLTVSTVAQRAGIPNAQHYVDASTLTTDEALADAAVRYTVFGRVVPEQKKKLLRALKEAGHTVAMTGDGVNDVLAMKESSCSIAMASGAQAASQVAQLVLLQSDFAAMPAIVGEGRRVINNIQRAASLFLVKNIFSLSLALVSLILGLSLPFIPLQLTLISSLTIGLPSFFLAMEPNYTRVSGRFMPTVLRRALPGGLCNLIMVVAAQLILPQLGLSQELISTGCVMILGVTGLLVLRQVCRPFDPFRHLLYWAVAVAMVFCFTVLSGFFDLTYGTWQDLLTLLATAAVTIPVFFLIGKGLDGIDRLIKK